jgi:SAM-dependent methyltransferase
VRTAPRRRAAAWDAERFFATWRAEIAHVLELADGLRPSRAAAALDFGLRGGAGSRARSDHGFERADRASTFGRRWSYRRRRLQTRRCRCEFRINAAEDLAQFEAGAFDFVYSSIVLQHLPSRSDIERYVSEFLRVTKPEGLAVFGIPAHVAFPYSLQPRRRLYALLRRLGVSEDWMLRRTSLTPMRMTVVTEVAVRSLVESRGAEVLLAEQLEDGPVRTVRYYVAPAAT